VQRRGGKARLEPLCAQQHEQGLRVSDRRVAVRAGGIDAPLEHVPRKPERTGHDAVLASLILRADVDEHGAVPHRRKGLAGGEPLEASAGRGEHVIDRRPPTHA
jgi:hypothetical protein